MTYISIDQALNDLMLRRSNGLPGLNRLKDCLAEMGNPHLQLKCIHIGGTNGKGSTTDFLRSIFQKADYKVGSFTSPFLVHHQDRFRINNQDIDDETLLKYINQTLPYWEKYDFSMFVIDMLISILYFVDEKVDVALYEVGLGGRLDATNVITPLVSVITNIGFDHMEQLGDTLEKIAYEKAGIIKQNVPLFTCENKEECVDVFLEVAAERNAKVTRVFFPRNSQIVNHRRTFTYQYIEVALKSLAIYQVANASLAMSVAINLKSEFPLLNDQVIKAGIEGTEWAGRFEKVSDEPLTIIDGAHNVEGIEALVSNFAYLDKPIICVFAALKDKLTDDMVNLLQANCQQVIVTEFDFYRVKEAKQLATNAQIIVEADYKKAIEMGRTLAKDGVLMITGSLYFISEVRKYYQAR